MIEPTIAWQRRSENTPPVAIRSGLEQAWPGSTSELLASAKSATLLTHPGSEVVIGELQSLEGGWWKGAILKHAAGSNHLVLGSNVTFHEDNVLGATL